MDVVAVKGLKVVGVRANPFGSDGVIGGDQDVGDGGIIDDGTDFLLEEGSGLVVGAHVGRLIREGLSEQHAGSPLEDEEFLGGLRGDRHQLDAGRPGSDHPDPFTGEVHAGRGPVSGVIQLAGERVPAGNGGHVGGGQCAGGHHTESGVHRVVPIGAYRPAQQIFVEDGRGDPGAAADITAQVEAVGDMVDVAQNFLLAGVLFGPVPLLL
ncbi:Uncharacterised protein [Mycobacteroides abscessus subsp. abscessus]|nr:Uncharacterised protein [Mycobacteroides abscessus subsp. abscessus]